MSTVFTSGSIPPAKAKIGWPKAWRMCQSTHRTERVGPMLEALWHW